MLELVAHRGYPGRFPENSLVGMRAALEAGARYVEFDVQFTRDHVPVVLHDASLRRTTGQRGMVFLTDYADVASRSAGEPARFGERFRDLRIPHLETLLELIEGFPAVTAFVEIKRASLWKTGRAKAFDILRDILASRSERIVLLSFDREFVARARDDFRIGWAFEPWKSHHRQAAEDLQPEYLFTSLRGLPPGHETFWQGPWRWAVYDVPSLATAQWLYSLGVDLVETDDIGDWLPDKFASDVR
ncbi:MAG: glycerophosphodiester phosphodiesterase [Proteobacteria bacterium]|nr:glycerophosphodiester phosphodiesterase [Pseudomonadota bacterium]